MPVQYEFQTQKPPLGGYDITTYCFDYSVFCSTVPGRDLNPHSHKPRDFKLLLLSLNNNNLITIFRIFIKF